MQSTDTLQSVYNNTIQIPYVNPTSDVFNSWTQNL